MTPLAASHPGLLIRLQCLKPNDLSVTDAAYILGVSRQALSNLLSGKAGISSEMAIRLDKAFGIAAEFWLQRQMAYDLAEARKHEASLIVHALTARSATMRQPELFDT